MKQVRYNPDDRMFMQGQSGTHYTVAYSEEGDLYMERDNPPSAFLVYPPDVESFYKLLINNKTHHEQILEENKSQYNSVEYWREKYFAVIKDYDK